MLVRVMKLPEEVRLKYDLSSLRLVLHAAAPCPVEVKRQVIEWLGPIVSEHYSATEGNGGTFITAAEWLEHPGSVGRPMAGVIHICDEDGRELPGGEAGDIYFEQEHIPFEYHGDPEKTRNTRHPAHGNWSTLGDIGYVDEGGYLYLTDRRAFTIISGGVNIYPAEIESCLIMHPKVADVAVFGLPDPEMGEYVHAVVQPADGVEQSAQLADELKDYARERVAGFKVPRVVDFRPELPRLPTGKLYKRLLRDEYMQARRS
jgi:acyl-coenzyme A synthetase/AMP-(fatty) acid ligase